ncbi:MAG: hypothetical protein AAB515_03375 [Patescibacteria group bacterium]
MHLPKLSALRRAPVVRLAILIVWAGATAFLAFHYIRSVQDKQTTNDAAAALRQVSRHVAFDGADPAVATVTDADTLKNKDAFYKRAMNGDKLVVWEEKALLYRPSTDRIIDFGVVVQKPTPDQPVQKK